MKNVLTMIAVIAFAVNNLNAQSSSSSDNRGNFSFGVKAGTNFSNVYDSNGDDFVAEGKFGLAVGAFFIIPLGKVIGFQPEVLYSQKGYKSTGKFIGTAYSMTRTTDFIDIPLLVSIKPVEYVSVVFGPQFSYLLKKTDNFKGGTLTSTQEQNYKNNDLRKNLFALTGGADINVQNFVIGVRAGWDLQENMGSGNTTTPRYKNVWYQATLGYKF